jgi:large subunit ribosomal protein L23
MNQERLMKVLRVPHVSEKSAMIGEANRQYVFQVLPDAHKPEIKAAVEQLFGVKVSAVQVVNLKGKSKRFGRMEGRRKNWKKAYVTLEEGHELDFMGVE